MIYHPDEIHRLLPLLDTQIAEQLEHESLDFKECPTENDLERLAKKSAVCFANASGGTIVFGIKERVIGRTQAVVGVNFAPDLLALKTLIYNSTDPKLPVDFEWMDDGPHRLLLMHVHLTMPPHTTTRGEGWERVGRDCMPLTGSRIHALRERVGLADPTPRLLTIPDAFAALSPAAMEILRREMESAGIAQDLLNYGDRELAIRLGILRGEQLTLGGLLLVGREDIIAEHVPAHEWKYSRMRSDTEYEVPPVGGRDCIVLALDTIMLVIGQHNPITTVASGLYHAEFPQYPVIALREALLNAFAHRDYTMPGMVFIRHYQDRLEIDSPGGFVGDVRPENILHHPPVTRNRYLVETVLLATRLVNRNNLGVPRMFDALLREGKEPPVFEQIDQRVRVAFPGQEVDQSFKALLDFLVSAYGARLDVDLLLLLHFFRRRHEVQFREIVEAYPYNERLLREKLAYLEFDLLLLERGGATAAATYRLSRLAASVLEQRATYDMKKRLDKEAIKVRIMTLLKDRSLRNEEIRAFTDLSRKDVTRVLKELEGEGLVRLEGKGVGARWYSARGQRVDQLLTQPDPFQGQLPLN